MNRRQFLKKSLAASLASSAMSGILTGTPTAQAAAAFAKSPYANRKVIVLGVDGVDPQLLDKFMGEGDFPNLRRLIAMGDYKRLETTMPPHTPVAWANFITGMDPGGHGIFDFLHRDAATLQPYLSVAKAWPAKHKIALGSWEVPLGGGKVELLRRGRAFWQLLEDAGVPTVIFRMPTNFPPSPSPGKSMSSVGTPDVLGTPGTFTFWTTKGLDKPDALTGGRVLFVKIKDGRVDLKLEGPPNALRREAIQSKSGSRQSKEFENPVLSLDLAAWLDSTENVIKLELPDRELILMQGEWSDWVRLDFGSIPGAVISSLARFYLKQVRPEFELYMTPMQINPEAPIMPIFTPEDWGKQLVADLGYFYTQEFPENTKALTSGVFTSQEFHVQASGVYDEERRFLDYLLARFDRGLLFHYVSSTDQIPHMLWRNMDTAHPGFEDVPELKDGIKRLYQRVDEAVGEVLKVADENTTVVVMSDHGFNPFYYAVNLNTWLLQNGYIAVNDMHEFDKFEYFGNVDWPKTRAYSVGLNGLYLNLKGRDKLGMVDPGQYDTLVDELKAKLLAWRDPERGNRPVITKITVPRRDFKGAIRDQGPDLVIGYAREYRSSWESPLGQFSQEVIALNKDPWSGDHCIDCDEVPGILIANRKINMEKPALHDMTAAVLAQFGVAPGPEMIGKNCLEVKA